jgi:hypothetical protein
LAVKLLGWEEEEEGEEEGEDDDVVVVVVDDEDADILRPLTALPCVDLICSFMFDYVLIVITLHIIVIGNDRRGGPRWGRGD